MLTPDLDAYEITRSYYQLLAATTEVVPNNGD